MLLSICMMVKNEAQNLPRCLESIKSLMEKLECELIIVDTGSEDETVNIAKQYTSKVFFHKWNNNFSEMRNITINYATGDWIFIIDADEELVDASSIISFFNSQTKEFNGAALRLDNVIKKNGDLGSTVLTVRFFRNNGKFKYFGSVHNILNIDGNIFELKSKLLHYGYIVDDNELMDIKFNRTRNMLVEALEKNPSNIYYQYQLATSYEMHKDTELAKLNYEKTYLLIKESKENKYKFIYFWGPFAKILILYKEYLRAIEIINEGLLLADDYVDLYYFLGIAYSGISNWDMAIVNFEKYLMLLTKSETLTIRKNPSVQLYSLGSKLECINNLTQCYIVANEWLKAQVRSKELIENTELSSDFFVNGINYFIRSCINLNDINSITDLYKKFPERSDNLDIIVNAFINQLNAVVQSEIQIYEELSKLPSKLGFIYKKLLKYLYGKDIVTKNIEYDYLDYIQKHVEEALYLALIENKNIAEILSSLDEQKMMELIANLNQKYNDFHLVVEKYMHQIDDNDSYETINMLRVFYKYLMIVNFDSENIITNMDKYFNVGMRYIKFKYGHRFLNRKTYSDYSNTEERLLAVVAKMSEDSYSKEYFANMCELFPEWKYQIAIWFETKIGISASDASDLIKKSAEIDQMILDLVKNIKFLMNEGHEAEAKLIIDEMKNIYHFNDLEISKLLN